jgi:hypothetical protein
MSVGDAVVNEKIAADKLRKWLSVFWSHSFVFCCTIFVFFLLLLVG